MLSLIIRCGTPSRGSRIPTRIGRPRDWASVSSAMTTILDLSHFPSFISPFPPKYTMTKLTITRMAMYSAFSSRGRSFIILLT